MRRICLVALVALAFALGPGVSGISNAAACTGILPPASLAGKDSRHLVADDLIRLRDIGQVWNFDATTPLLAVSPDGMHVAFQLRRADVDANSYCLGMVVVDVNTHGIARLVDSGGDYIRIVQDMGSLTNYPSGYTEVITPKWSPDGESIAYRRRDNGVTQAWMAAADGSGSHVVTKLSFDVDDLAWSADGQYLVISGRPGLAEAMANLDQEGRSGYLFDDRFIPFAGSKPFPRATVPTTYYAIDVSTGKLRDATDRERRALQHGPTPELPQDAEMPARGPNGQIAWAGLTDPANIASSNQLRVRRQNGTDSVCRDVACHRIRAIWWTDKGEIIFQNREGWGGSKTGLYEWMPQRNVVRRIWLSDDVLLGCQPARTKLICSHEGSLQPRELMAIDLETGQKHTLFNPNPEFNRLSLGSVERMHWLNDRGIETFGDLVLPPDHRPGQVHPLILVQYESRGFLRGGTDDDYPIQLFATNGFAVLSFERPKTVGDAIGAQSWEELARLDREDWADRRSVLSAMETGVGLAINKGVVDAQRIGITGQSDGSSAVRFALLNSSLFTVAAISSCCEDETSLMTTYGADWRAYMHRIGYPLLTEDGSRFWADYSLRRNAERMKTPLLMQLADNEYLSSLESYVALSEQKAPVEMYVFPDEYHQLWQPAHRHAVYTRSLDWFGFWLNGIEDSDPSKQEQYKRWRALRANLPASGAAPGR